MMALMRSRIDRKIAGVCGGIAEQNGWDPTMVRLVWVAMVLFAGTGVFAYLVLWIVIPEAPYILPYQAGYAQPPQTYSGAGYAPPVAGPHAGGQTYQGGQAYPGQPGQPNYPGSTAPPVPPYPGAAGGTQYRG